MTDERYFELKKEGVYNKEANVLIALNELFHKYVYLHSFNSIEKEKKRVLKLITNK